MEKASKAFKKSDWEGFDGSNVRIPRPIQEIAVTFLNLQEARHQADYDPTIRLLRTNVQAQVSRVQRAFLLWAQVKATFEADYYLMALLTGNRRRH